MSIMLSKLRKIKVDSVFFIRSLFAETIIHTRKSPFSPQNQIYQKTTNREFSLFWLP